MTNEELWLGEWREITVEEHQWLRTNKEEIADCGQRWFVPRDRHRWPLLCVTVFAEYPTRPPGVRISVSYKEHGEAWFQDCNLPRSLVPRLIESLENKR